MQETNVNVFTYKFENNSVQKIRTVIKDDEPWFIAKDICDILSLENSRKAVSVLDCDERMSLKVTSGGQKREMNIVSESGLYTLIIRSNKPQAKLFRRWVTHEVLPQIRKFGHYGQRPVSQQEVISFFQVTSNAYWHTEKTIKRCKALETELKSIKREIAKVIGSIESIFPESSSMFDDLHMKSITKHTDMSLPLKVDMA